MNQFCRYLTEAEEKQLMRHLDALACPLARRDAGWIRLLRQTGIRVGSAARLTVDDARAALTSGYLDVRDDIAKGGRGYRVFCNKPARAALNTLLLVRRELGASPNADGPPVVTRRGGAMSVRSFQARMAQAVAAAGLLLHATPHWLRHTRAIRLIDRGEAKNPLGIVQAALGHASLKSTGIYTVPTREQVARELERVG